DKYRLDDFELYQLALKFRQNVYKLIKQLPSEERYCLDPQMRKVIVSVTNNIAEGHGPWHYAERVSMCLVVYVTQTLRHPDTRLPERLPILQDGKRFG
ncbi:MAG: four helix bundle protein, partial [bacterium]